MSIIVIGRSPAREYRWMLRNGQRACVGRSAWAEFCLEDDDQLLEFHCCLEIDLDQQPLVIPIADAEIMVDKSWRDSTRDHQELQIVAGQSRLILRRARNQELRLPSVNTDTGLASASHHALERPAIQLLRDIGLSDTACRLLSSTSAGQGSPVAAVQLLVDSDLPDDALRYLAATLPARHRLEWCHQLLQESGCELRDDAAGLVQLWLVDATEALRAAIAEQVDWNHKHDPCTWLLASIGWTGGSLASSSSIHVPPPDQMIVTGVITALSLAAAQGSASEFQLHALALGTTIVSQLEAQYLLTR